jgi:sec-independent protein translocase protein TatB
MVAAQKFAGVADAMFDIGWSELLLIAVVALVVIGPKELPGALRTLGQWMTKVRRMASEFQNQFQDAIREAELAELKKEVDEMAAKASSYTQFDPLEDVRRDIEKAAGDLPPFDAQSESGSTLAAPAVSEPATAAQVAPPAAEETAAPATPATPPAEEPVAVGTNDVKPDPKPDAGRAA